MIKDSTIINIVKYLPIKLRNFTYIPRVFKKINEKSYYPEKKRKNLMSRFFDNLVWLFKNNEINEYYNLYGLDIVKSERNHNAHDFTDYYNFSKSRDALNERNSVFPLRNKYLFYCLLSESSLPTPKVYCLFSKTRNQINFIVNDFSKIHSDFFIKTINGVCGDGVYHFNNISEIKKLPNGTFIAQERIYQKYNMSSIFPDSINTIRIVTEHSNNKYNLFCSALRVGNKNTHGVDNWGQGGIAISITDGKLDKFGCYKPKYFNKDGLLTNHPDTGFKFENYKIPEYENALSLCLKAHKLFKGVKFIGWDVAITDSGPCIIEGNDNFELTIFQYLKPMKKQWYKEIKDRGISK